MATDLIVTVDMEDRPVDLVSRAAITYDDIYRVGALWVHNAVGNVLLAQRKLTKRNDPGKWGPAAAGTVEAGEDYDSNVVKEAAEELGITGTAFDRGPKTFVDTGTHRFFIQWYVVQLDCPAEEFIIQTSEVEQVAWWRADALAAALVASPERFTAAAPQDWPTLLNRLG